MGGDAPRAKWPEGLAPGKATFALLIGFEVDINRLALGELPGPWRVGGRRLGRCGCLFALFCCELLLRRRFRGPRSFLRLLESTAEEDLIEETADERSLFLGPRGVLLLDRLGQQVGTEVSDLPEEPRSSVQVVAQRACELALRRVFACWLGARGERAGRCRSRGRRRERSAIEFGKEPPGQLVALPDAITVALDDRTQGLMLLFGSRQGFESPLGFALTRRSPGGVRRRTMTERWRRYASA